MGMQAATRHSFIWVAPICAVWVACAAVSQESVTLVAPSAPEGLQNALRAASSTLRLLDTPASGENEILATARSDYGRLLGVAYEEGYYSASISIRADGQEVAEIAPLAAPERIRSIRIFVAPGPQFSFGRTKIQPVPAGTDLPDGFKAGEPARSPLIIDAGSAAIEAWRDAGHAKADIVGEQVTAFHDQARLDVTLDVDPGPQLRFGDLRVSGNEDVRTERVAAIAGLPTGAIFEPVEVADARRRLAENGAFRSVVLREAELANPDDTLDFDLEVQEEAKRRLGFGAEFETDEGLALSAFWFHRNLLGGAERLRFDARIENLGADTSSLDYLLGVSFTKPAFIDAKTRLLLGAKIETEDEDLYRYNLGEVEVGLERRISNTSNIGAGVKYVYAEVDFNEEIGDFSETYNLVAFPLYAERDGRERLPTDPERGLFTRGEVEPFIGIGDAQAGTRFAFDGRFYQSIDVEERVILASRVFLGSVVGPDGLDVQPDYWLFSGGSGTVRGQPFESLGIFETEGEPRVGRSLAVLNLEARFRQSDSLGFVGFVDVAQIGPDELPSSDSLWHGGYGFGVRYATPIGPLRADFGLPITGTAPEPSSQYQLYIGIGQAF